MHELLDELDFDPSFWRFTGHDSGDQTEIRKRIIEALTLLEITEGEDEPDDDRGTEFSLDSRMLAILQSEVDADQLVLTMLYVIRRQMQALNDTPEAWAKRMLES
jgi:hypothetical protein